MPDTLMTLLTWGGGIVGGIVGLWLIWQLLGFFWIVAKVLATPQYQKEKRASWDKGVWEALHNHKLYFGLMILGLGVMLWSGFFLFVLPASSSFETRFLGFAKISFGGFLPFICLHYLSIVRARAAPPDDTESN